MRISLKIILAFSVVIALMAILGYVMIIQLNKISGPFNEEVPETLDQIHQTSKMDADAQLMKYYDEVLTQSARNYAFTQDKKWEERYKVADPALDLIIKDAIKIGDSEDRKFFSKVNESNIALLKMEYSSLELVDKGNPSGAIKILESKEYWDQKNIYQEALVNYVKRHGSEYNDALVIHTQELDRVTTNTLDLIKNETKLFSILIPAMLIISIIVGFVIAYSISKPISNLEAVTEKISNGNFEIRADVTGNDEISNLSMKVNIMTEKLGVYRKELVKAERLMAIGELAARLAHDLRNPLSVIKNSIEIIRIKSYAIGQENETLFERIGRATDRMTHQVDEVLDFVKPKQPVLTKSTILEILKNSLERINIPEEIKVILPQCDIQIVSDSAKLEIVFSNLVSNAIQAMQNEGSIMIRAEDKNDHVLVEVEDTGPGVSPEVLPKIFDPLFTTRQIGTGLGLVSCKNIIEGHGGTIEIKTELGKGTTFIIKLPKFSSKLEKLGLTIRVQ